MASWPGDVGDGTTPLGEQVFHREPGSAALVDDYRAVIEVRRRLEGVDHRCADHRPQRRPGFRPPSGDDDPVDPAIGQRFQIPRLSGGSSRLSQMRTASSPTRRASSAPIKSGILNRPKLSVVISPTEKLRRAINARAMWFGRKRSSLAAACTRSRVSAGIPALPFNAFDTVLFETPASAATSLIVTTEAVLSLHHRSRSTGGHLERSALRDWADHSSTAARGGSIGRGFAGTRRAESPACVEPQ